MLAPGGYGGDIDMMTGINAAGEVTGMSVISHAETSGLGSKATDPNWQSQFVGSTEDVSVTEGRRHHQRHHRLHHHLPLRVQRCQRRPCGRGSTGLRREQENEF